MKMVKSLLLGTAAGIMAVAGAQAADLPVKAKPVEYVKVCSLYGAGFYYMPGTDICLKIGGYVRAQYTFWGGQTGTVNNWTGGAANNRSNQAEDTIFRVRVIASFDTRQQTEYGTLRTYMNLGYTHDAMAGNAAGAGGTQAGSGLYVNRGFIQLAGFTFGKAQSFFDILGTASVSYFAWPASDSGDGGKNLAAYTAQFGNGFSGTLSVEEAKRTAVTNGQYVTVQTPANINTPLSNYANSVMPDIVANLRVDQAWGSAQIMGAVHQVRANYYGASLAGTVEGNGHPEDKYGWVIGGGVQLNADMISKGDKFQLQASYTQGALRYMADTQGTANYARTEGLDASFGAFTDGVYTTGSSIDLTKAWQATATYDHVWSQKWKTSLYGGIVAVNFSDTAGNALCFAYNMAPGVAGNCDSDWSTWWVGSRTQFNINASTYMGVDVLYTKLNTANEGGVIGMGTGANKPAAVYAIRDMDNLGVTFRVHRDFLP